MRECAYDEGNGLVFLFRHQVAGIFGQGAGEGHHVLFAADGQVICYRIFDDLHQFHRCVGGPDTHFVQQLYCRRRSGKFKLRLNENERCVDSPIRPPNRLNVRGIRVCGFTSISTFLAVWMYTCSKPARFNGESNSINSDWWVMSGRHPAGSLLFRRMMLMWSSQLSNSNVFPTCEWHAS